MDPHPPAPTQLPLPLEVPTAAIPSPPPLVEVVIQPRTLWRRLPLELRERLRQTLIQIGQEVLDDGTQR